MKMSFCAALAGLAAAALAGCAEPAPKTEMPIASIPAAPVESYTCQNGRKLSVKLLGATAELALDGGAAMTLNALGQDGTTYSNGRHTIVIRQGVLSYGAGRMIPAPCAAG
jgi:membrane-bound inhibitor of C-type lysozyme